MTNTKTLQVPDIGDSKDVTIIEVLIAPGDRIEVDMPLMTLESDKATLEVPSPQAGLVKAVRVVVGDKVSMGSPIAEIEVSGEDPHPASHPAEDTPSP